ncbi:hypothetical protein GF327_05745 [Candidatus Woesearchaeota archaeon]|nr:hypothetical protein [Candidatus Woesearchaeota archaeon]
MGDFKDSNTIIDQNRENPEFLDKVIERFLQGEELGKLREDYGSFPISKAIEYLPDRGSEYFEQLYDRLLALDDPEQDIVQRVVNNYHAKEAAVKRITNESYLKKLVEHIPDDVDFGRTTPQAIAIRGIHDQAYLERIVETKRDARIKEEAILRLTDKEILRQYAGMSDKKCDQHRYRQGGLWKLFCSSQKRREFALEAFNNLIYRTAARKRLQEL